MKSMRDALDNASAVDSRQPTDLPLQTNHPAVDRLSEAIAQWTQRMIWIERGAAVVLLVLMLLTMSSQVIARYVFNSPYSWSEELSRLLMIWMIFMAAAHVMAEGGHIAVDLWSSRVSRRFCVWCDCLVNIVVIGTAWLLLIGGLPFVWYVHPVGSPSLGIPKSLWYAAVSIGLLLISIHSLLNLILLVRTGQPAQRSNAFDVDEGFHLQTKLEPGSQTILGEPRS
jgi:TRAP-type transport system small permease protein